MSNKLGLMLSLVIFMQSFLMIFDMYNVQLINSELVLGSNYVNNLILKGPLSKLNFNLYAHKH